MNQKEFIGIGCINKIDEIIKENAYKKILLVTGKKSYIDSNSKSKLSKYLRSVYTEQFNQFRGPSNQVTELFQSNSVAIDLAQTITQGTHLYIN